MKAFRTYLIISFVPTYILQTKFKYDKKIYTTNILQKLVYLVLNNCTHELYIS